MPNVSNVHKSEFQQLLEQAMSQAPDIVTGAECKGSEAAEIALASAASHTTCISNVGGLEISGNWLYGCR